MVSATSTQWSKIQAIAIARAFSLLGTELTIFTLVFRDKDFGPAAVAALFIVGTLPMIIFAPWSGTVADKYSTKAVIPIASLIGGAAILAQTLPLDTWAVLALLFVANTCATVVGPTWGKLIPILATKEDLGRAMGTTQTYFSLAGLAGPVVAGFLISQTGFFWTFVIDAVATTFIATVPFLLNVNHQPTKGETGEKTDVAAGFKFLFTNSLLRALVLMIFFMVLAVSVVNVGDVFLITDILGGNAQIYGLVGTGFAIGTLSFSAFAASKKIRQMSELRAVGIGALVLAACTLAVGLAPNYWVVMALWALAGASLAPLNTYGVAMMVKVVPHEVQGRVFAAFGALVSVASIGSMSVAGLLIGALGVREVFVVAGVLSILVVLVLFPSVYREQRKIIETCTDTPKT
jgi:MFS family permease